MEEVIEEALEEVNEDTWLAGEDREFSLLNTMVAGVIAGFVVTVVFYPLEYVEAVLQTSTKQRGLFAIFWDVLQTKGVLGLFTGVWITAIGMAINTGVYFVIYEGARTMLSQVVSGPAFYNLLSACISGTISSFIVNPFWVLKIRSIGQPEVSIFQHLFRMVESEGVWALWAGMVANLCGVLDGAIGMIVYEQMKAEGFGFATSGMTARLLSILLTYPYQVVRSKMQQADPKKGKNRAGVLISLKRIYLADGVSGFYKGMIPNIVRSVPPSGVMFFLLEVIKQLLRSVV